MWQTTLKILFTGFVVVTAYYALQRIWSSEIDLGSWFRGASLVIPVKSTTVISIVQVSLSTSTPLSLSYQDRIASKKRSSEWEAEYRKYALTPNRGGVTLYPAEWVEDPFGKERKVISFDDTSAEYIKFRIAIGVGVGKLVFREVSRGQTNGFVHRRLWFRITKSGQPSMGWCSDEKAIKLKPARMPGRESLSLTETQIPLSAFSLESIRADEGDEIEILFVCFPQDGIPGPYDVGGKKGYSFIGDWHLVELEVLEYP